MRLGLNQLKISISIHLTESENNSILINTPTNYEDSSAYSPEKGFGAYQGNEYGGGYGAPSGLHPDYGRDFSLSDLLLNAFNVSGIN